MTDDRWLLTDEERAARGMGPWTKMDDPAHVLLTDGYTTTPTVRYPGCFICEDPEFAQMGLPLCKSCPECTKHKRNDGGHIPADDVVCSYCDYEWGPDE